MYIVSISVEEREEKVPEVQKILTKYGDKIETRIGLHNTQKERKGLIIVVYNSEDVEEFIEEINLLKNVTANFMEA